MTKHKLVAPEDFIPEHICYIEKLKAAIKFLPQTPDLKIYMKDINSRIIFAPDSMAVVLGVKSSVDIEGKLASELPCLSVASSSDQFREQEQELINSDDPKRSMSVLNVFNYSHGWHARRIEKNIIYHKESDSILGTIHQSTPVEVKNFVNIIPSYILRFGVLGDFEIKNKSIEVNNVHLTEYEEEICFLLLLNWEFKQIAKFMNEFRPNPQPRNANTIIKAKNCICNKFKLPLTNKEALCRFLFAAGFHKKFPSSFYKNMIGATIIQ